MTSKKSSNLGKYLLQFIWSVPHSSLNTAAVKSQVSMQLIPQHVRPVNQTGIHRLPKHNFKKIKHSNVVTICTNFCYPWINETKYKLNKFDAILTVHRR
jgi:hypothetical protein